jgi:hypothetical protein
MPTGDPDSLYGGASLERPTSGGCQLWAAPRVGGEGQHTSKHTRWQGRPGRTGRTGSLRTVIGCLADAAGGLRVLALHACKSRRLQVRR